jgi:hypothetical protein
VTPEEWESELHALLGLRVLDEKSRDIDYREPGRRPLSGPWRGYYLQPALAFGPVEMKLVVDMRGEELVAEGTDRIGYFTLQGMVEPATGEARLRKHYVGTHSVQYVGVLRDGILRGVWSLPASEARGLFVLGPEGAVPAKTQALLGRVPTAVAMLLGPFRIGTILRHRYLANSFLADHPRLRAWLA